MTRRAFLDRPNAMQQIILAALAQGRQIPHCRTMADRRRIARTLWALRACGWLDDSGVTIAGRAVIGMSAQGSTK